jgi:rSAM/selenodomain-associated transferase 1
MLLYTPPERRADFEAWLGPDFRYEAQSEGDLGARLEGAFERAFAEGAARVVVVGTDCPGLDGSHLAMAFEGLRGADAVLGPAADGGYYLLGLTRLLREVFRGIPWSTERTLAETLDRLRTGGHSVVLLPTLRDVDRPEDLDAPPAPPMPDPPGSPRAPGK